MNNTKRGNFNRNKTKKHFEKLGYDVAVVEQSRFFAFGGRRWVKKSDCFGADLLAMDGSELVFIQCKTGAPKKAECAKEFSKWKFPKNKIVRRVIVCWKLRARVPAIIEA